MTHLNQLAQMPVRTRDKPSNPPQHLMRFGINTFLFVSPFTTESTKLFKKFKLEDEVAVESKVKEKINEARRQAREAGDKDAKRPAPDRADQLAFDKKQLKDFENGKRPDPPEGTAFSDKSRNPADYPSTKEFLDQVSRDAVETVDKYGGDIKLKSEKFGPKMSGQTISVKRMFQIFDGDLIKDVQLRESIKAAVKLASDGKVEAVFSDELGTRFSSE